MSPKLSKRVHRNIREAKTRMEFLMEDLTAPPPDFDDRGDILDQVMKLIMILVWARDRLVDDIRERPVQGDEQLLEPRTPA
jgi:hypothetical protein